MNVLKGPRKTRHANKCIISCFCAPPPRPPSALSRHWRDGLHQPSPLLTPLCRISPAGKETRAPKLPPPRERPPPSITRVAECALPTPLQSKQFRINKHHFFLSFLMPGSPSEAPRRLAHQPPPRLFQRAAGVRVEIASIRMAMWMRSLLWQRCLSRRRASSAQLMEAPPCKSQR